MTTTEPVTPVRSRSAKSPARRRYAVILAVVFIASGLLLSAHPIGKLIAIVAVLSAAVIVSVERMVVILLVMFIAMEDFTAGPFNGLWDSPVQEVGDFFFATIGSSVPWVPIPLAPMLLCPLILLYRTLSGRTGTGMSREIPPLQTPRVFGTALVLAGGTVGLGALYGVGTGGNPQQVYYQIFGTIIALSFATTLARIGSPQLATMLWRIILLVGIYRAGLAIYVHFEFAVELDEAPLYLTTHADSIIWTLGLTYLVSNLLERADRISKLAAFTLAPLLGIAIVVNNRRLAWVMVAAAMGYMLWTLIGVGRERIREGAAYFLPLMGTYLAAGWVAPPSRFFSPVQSLKSVFNGDDRSSQTRDIEDFNLLFTARTTFPLPSGYGKPYVELVVADDISQFFEQYRFLPHNTVLGVLTMVGPIGLALIIAPLILGVHAAHRVRMVAREADIRTTTAMVLAAWVSFLAFAWGDLGFFTPQPTAMVGIAAGLGVSLHSWYGEHGQQAGALRSLTRNTAKPKAVPR